MGAPSPLSSVLSFLLGVEASISGLGETGAADLERRLEGIVGEDEAKRGREREMGKKERAKMEESEREKGRLFIVSGEREEKLGARFRSWAGNGKFFGSIKIFWKWNMCDYGLWALQMGRVGIDLLTFGSDLDPYSRDVMCLLRFEIK